LETNTLVLIILAFLASLFLAVFQYIYNKKDRSQLNYWLSFLRFLALFFIFILIINPSVKKENIETIKPNLLVAIDNSSSIKYQGLGDKVLNLLSHLKNNSSLNAKFSINYFSFGNKLEVLDSLKFDKNHTNLNIPFSEFSNLYKEGNNPVVLITDGNQTIGNNVEFVTYKSKIYPFIVGDTTKIEDIFINQLNVNKATYVNNKFPIELFINYTGKNDVVKNLKIFHDKNLVYSKQLHFSSTKNVQSESIYLTSIASGTQYYTASIEALNNEKNTINNTKSFSINVLKEQSKILIIAATIHPDLGMLKKSIESNKQRFATIVSIDNYKEKISDYQLVILYQPTSKFKKIFNDVFPSSVNYFIITGSKTDWDFLNKSQSIFSKNHTKQLENYNPILNLEYATFQTKNSDFSNFSPLEDVFGAVKFSIPNNILLFQQIGSIKTEKPLLATFENDNQKGAVLFGENSWKWRMSSFLSSKSFEEFDGFISNLIQYLSSNKINNRLNVSVEHIFYSNDNIKISANYLDENLNFDSRAKLWCTVLNKETQLAKKFPFTLLNNDFRLDLNDFPPGEYSYSVSVENQKEVSVGSFKILPLEIENLLVNSNDAYLKIAASNSNGKVFYNDQEDDLINFLLTNNQFKSIQKSTINKTPLIEWKWILSIIIALLSIEWFVRKYFGKI
jgi:hypothetical protein